MASAASLARPCSQAAVAPAVLPSKSRLARAVRVRAAAQAEAPPASVVQQLKADIKRLSGSKYGHDLDAASK